MGEQTKPATPPASQPVNPAPQAGQVEVKFYFEKSPFYRTIHASGAWGRLDPSANIHITFFNEKPQMPLTGVVKNTPDGQWVLDQNKYTMAHDAPMIREIEFDVVMNLWSATLVRDVLTNFINIANESMQEAMEKAAAAHQTTK